MLLSYLMPDSEIRHPNLAALALRVGVYVVLYILGALLLTPLFAWVGGFFAGITLSAFLSAALANSLAMRIWENRHLAGVGFQWTGATLRNLGWGLVGGAGSASLALCPALLAGAARLAPAPQNDASLPGFAFITILLVFGAAGEEMLFRGYGFQVLLRAFGPWTTILPVAAVFAALHGRNPGVTPLALANTAGFGILFGYAFLRSHDLWLPIGLHFGWNFTLPLFGVNVSGFTMRLTNYSIQWRAGMLWSGGDYGPEASVLTSIALVALGVFLWKAPIGKQRAVLLDEPGEA